MSAWRTIGRCLLALPVARSINGLVGVFVFGLGVVLTQAEAASACASPKTALGVSRVVEIDATTGPIYGKITRYAHEPSFLRDKEIVLTFDDGPTPSITRSILKTLEQFCTKATFFAVGKMAIAYPRVLRETMQAGHTVGAHTWSHPRNLRHLKQRSAKIQIEKGFAAITKAAGTTIAPFFRFPGLNDDPRMLAYMQTRGIATFTVDVVSDDSYTPDAKKLARQTVARTVARHGGIVLFHDIKQSTAKALPSILAEFKKRGFKIVHLTSKHSFTPVGNFEAELNKRFLKAIRGKTLPELALKPPVHPVGSFAVMRPPVTQLAPAARAIKRVSTRKRRLNVLRGSVAAKGWKTTVDRLSNVKETHTIKIRKIEPSKTKSRRTKSHKSETEGTKPKPRAVEAGKDEMIKKHSKLRTH